MVHQPARQGLTSIQPEPLSPFNTFAFQTGLTQACLESTHSTEFVAKSVLNYIKKWVPYQRTAVLAGNSVHVDRTFLAAEMPEIVEWLHYRCVPCIPIQFDRN
jgi:oligoribonuclease